MCEKSMFYHDLGDLISSVLSTLRYYKITVMKSGSCNFLTTENTWPHRPVIVL